MNQPVRDEPAGALLLSATVAAGSVGGAGGSFPGRDNTTVSRRVKKPGPGLACKQPNEFRVLPPVRNNHLFPSQISGQLVDVVGKVHLPVGS